MTKRKILMLAMSICMVAILAVGGTLAYFTDTDDATNTFTMGVVEIDLEENFDEENADLVPGLDITKQIWVENTGSNAAYVRVHIAIPSELDDGNPNFAAVNNFLHFNFASASVAAGEWSWLPEYSTGTGYAGNGAGNWNFYEWEIDGKDYNVYVVTYRTAVEAGEQTATNAMEKVYVDTSVDAERKTVDGVAGIEYSDDKGNVVWYPVGDNDKVSISIPVIAEATQIETFDNAYDALNTAFGVPGEYDAWANYVAD